MILLVIAMFVLLSHTDAGDPAIQVILTDKGLQYGKHIGAGQIQKILEKATLPDIHGEINILVGSIAYTLSGVAVKKCDFPEPAVEFAPENYCLKTSISGLNIALSGNWEAHFGCIHASGSFDMAIYGVDVTSGLGLGIEAGGHLSVFSTGCQAAVQDVDVEFHGGSGWIVSQLAKHFKDDIMKKTQDNICIAVEVSTDRLESHLQAMNISYDVGQVLSLELPLTSIPVIDTSNLTFGLKGEFYNIKTHQEPPFVLKRFMMPQLSKFMLSAGVSEFTLNSASFGYFSAGQLQIVINDSMISQYGPFHLNTSKMGPFIPQLPKMFPDLLMVLHVCATRAPTFTLSPGVVQLSVQSAVKSFAIEKNSTQVSLFTLNADMKLSGDMEISNGKLKGSVMMDNFTLSLVSTEVGPVKINSLGNIIKTGIQMMVLPKLNAKLKEGIVLPRSKNVQPVNSNLTVEKGFIVISSDVQVLDS